MKATECTEADVKYKIVCHAQGRSFPEDDAFYNGQTNSADVVVHLGGKYQLDAEKLAVLVELDTECLGVHTGENNHNSPSNAVGFARFINGQGLTNLIELVRQPATTENALNAARTVFETQGFKVAVCGDQAGRIIDRLVRPKYNDALRFLDEGLASAEAMNMTCQLGLGYTQGPIEAVYKAGLARHYDVSQAIFSVTGRPGYAPARAAAVAKARESKR